MHRLIGSIVACIGLVFASIGIVAAPAAADPPANCREGRVAVSVVCHGGHWVPNKNACPEGIAEGGFRCVAGKWIPQKNFCVRGQTAPNLECVGGIWVPSRDYCTDGQTKQGYRCRGNSWIADPKPLPVKGARCNVIGRTWVSVSGEKVTCRGIPGKSRWLRAPSQV